MRNGSVFILLILLIGVILIAGCTNSTEAPVVTPVPTDSTILTGVSGDISTLQPTPTISAISEVTLENPETTEAQKISQAIDYLNTDVHNFALQQVQHSSAGYYNIAQICDVWQTIRNQWTYVSDPPNFDYWTSASDSINNGLKGNCADYATLNAAVMESIGGSARVVTACAPGGSPCHAYAEVFISDNYSDLQSITDSLRDRYGISPVYYHSYVDPSGNTEYWLNLDWQAYYPGGPFFQDDGSYNIFYPNGVYDVITNSGSTVVASTPSMQYLTGLTSGGTNNQEAPLVIPTTTSPALLYVPTTAQVLLHLT